jgi:hypothetical protein
MKTTRHYLKLLIREEVSLLRESSGFGEDLAVVVRSAGSLKQAIIYDADVLFSKIDGLEKLSQGDGMTPVIRAHLADTFVKGFIEVGPPRGMGHRSAGPCNGAWMVYRSAGPGYGKIVYGVGFALSPSGRLIPDRLDVSDSAKAGWDKQFTGGRGRLPLDDIDAHRDGGTIRPHPNHTDDPSDDCMVFKDLSYEDDGASYDNDQQLNYSYDAVGWEVAELEKMSQKHQDLMSQLKSGFADYLEGLIVGAGAVFFGKHIDT